jgi:hypothetical protein
MKHGKRRLLTLVRQLWREVFMDSSIPMVRKLGRRTMQWANSRRDALPDSYLACKVCASFTNVLTPIHICVACRSISTVGYRILRIPRHTRRNSPSTRWFSPRRWSVRIRLISRSESPTVLEHVQATTHDEGRENPDGKGIGRG